MHCWAGTSFQVFKGGRGADDGQTLSKLEMIFFYFYPKFIGGGANLRSTLGGNLFGT